MALVPLVTRAHGAGYGGESVFDNWFADISAESRPADTLRCENVKIPAGRVRTELLALNHSSIYECEEVSEKIARWIRDLPRSV
jgi:hypothetical protein